MEPSGDPGVSHPPGMTAGQELSDIFDGWAVRTGWVMEAIWLVTIFLVPIAFVTPGIMDNGYEVPRVTLYRSLVGLMAALWAIEWGLMVRWMPGKPPAPSLAGVKRGLFGGPIRWVVVGSSLVLAGNLISTLLSPSISISLWGSEPAIDGHSFYTTATHFVLFAIVATHLKTTAQLWRLLTAFAATGFIAGGYGILQYYGLDPFNVHIGGGRIVSTIGNPVTLGAFLLMVLPLTLVWGLEATVPTRRPVIVPLAVPVLSVLLLPVVFTQARGPWVGLFVALTGFLVLASITSGWRTGVRAGGLLAAALVITVAVLTFVPQYSGDGSGSGEVRHFGIRALSIERDVRASLVDGVPASEASSLLVSDFPRRGTPSSMKSRILIWEGAGHWYCTGLGTNLTAARPVYS